MDIGGKILEIKFLNKEKDINKANGMWVRELAELLAEAFPHCYGDCTLQDMEEYLEDERIALAAVEDGHLVGFVGAMPQYDYAWELHPLAIRKAYQHRGIGTMLVHALEKECAGRGVLTIYLGADDESEATSLGGTDLFEDTYGKIQNIKNLKKHPFEFYQKLGYRIVGVIPDANGEGKPDIFMARRIQAAESVNEL